MNLAISLDAKTGGAHEPMKTFRISDVEFEETVSRHSKSTVGTRALTLLRGRRVCTADKLSSWALTVLRGRRICTADLLGSCLISDKLSEDTRYYGGIGYNSTGVHRCHGLKIRLLEELPAQWN